MSVLVTGAAGFIGMHVCHALLDRGEHVVGLDNLNAYYDPALKQARLETLLSKPSFDFQKCELDDRETVFDLFERHKPIDRVVHLAAQAGVRHSLVDPYAYVKSNVMGHLVILEACRAQSDFKHLVYASSSSVYGGNSKIPFSVTDRVDEPVSLYAATKRADELMTSCYAHLFDLPSTGLRFFTVYGPWGRPDMAPWLFTEAILTGKPIRIFNHGKMRRDFTYVDDIVDGVVRALSCPPEPIGQSRPHQIFNLGNDKAEELLTFVSAIEDACGVKAEKIFIDMQPGDVEATHADVTESRSAFDYEPATPISQGVPEFVKWYRRYKGL